MKKVMYLFAFMFGLLILSSAFVSADWTSNLNTGLVSYYDLNNPSITDATGRQDGTIVGTDFAQQSGKVGNAMFQTSETGGCIYAPISNPSFINLGRFESTFENGASKSWSVSFWHYPPSSFGAKFGSLWSYYDDDVNFNPGQAMYFSKVSPTSFAYTFSQSEQPVPTVSYNLDAWNHFVIEKDGSTMKVYINGVLQVNAAGTPVDESRVGDYMALGRWSNCAYHATGGYDEVGIWNRTLTNDEVQQLYNSGAGVTYEPEGAEIVTVPFTMTLDAPANNYISPSTSVSLDCDIDDAAELLNITLIVDGVNTFTVYNTTANQTDLELLHNMTFQDQTSHTWTCYGVSRSWNDTAPTRTFSISLCAENECGGRCGNCQSGFTCNSDNRCISSGAFMTKPKTVTGNAITTLQETKTQANNFFQNFINWFKSLFNIK